MTQNLSLTDAILLAIDQHLNDDYDFQADEDFCVDDYAGGNVDDAFEKGVLQGEYNVASQVAGMILAYERDGTTS